MEKVTVKDLVDFRRKSERSKKTFVKNLNLEKKSSDNSGGGDYWRSSLSAITNSVKNANPDLLDEKIDALVEKIKYTETKRIKDQYQRNIDLLNIFKDIDPEEIKPAAALEFQNQPRIKSILEITDFPIEAKPSFVYSFSENGSEEIGGLWVVAKLNGYNKNELGMFTDILYRYLEVNFSKEYSINPTYCIALDVFNATLVRYTELQNGEIPILIDSTIEEMKRL